ncbi:MAG: hypothetical protein NVS2B8_04750 [Vulcanimicrobiaceae bacterium]
MHSRPKKEECGKGERGGIHERAIDRALVEAPTHDAYEKRRNRRERERQERERPNVER